MIARVNRLTYLVILLMETLNVQTSYSSLKMIELLKKKKNHIVRAMLIYTYQKLAKKKRKRASEVADPTHPVLRSL